MARNCVILLLILSGALAGCAADVPPTDLPYDIRSHYSVNDKEFQQTVGNLLGPPIMGGNELTTLVNGVEIFPAMLEAIRSAQRTVNFETYVYWRGEVGAQFAEALSEQARNGVRVNVILDSFGAGRIDPEYVQQMTDAGAKVIKYHPLKWFDIGWTKTINNRTHRKLLIVDGSVGFIGGVGIADEWMGNAEDAEHYRDTHYRVTGPVVSQLQAAFVDNWMESTGEVLHGSDYFPENQNTGDTWTQLFKSSPRGGSESMELMYLLSMAAAHRNIRLCTPYFVPGNLTIRTILRARQRGVVVQIILPGPTIDEKVVRSASRARWKELLEAGVEIYEYGPAMYHCKLMIVDDAWVSIGSANLDNRSFRLNDEANLNVLDSEFAMEQVRIFEADLRQCRRVDLGQWKDRPALQKATDSFLTLFGWLM